MKTTYLKRTARAVFAASVLVLAISTRAADKKPSKPDTEAEYTAKLEQRAADILKALELTDDAKTQRVRGIVIAQYRALRDWHDGLGPKLKGAGDEEARVIRASLKELHGKFIARLSAELTPAQVERVKDRMTYDTVRVTYNGYLEMLPKLTEAQKARILAMLKEAREEAMDGGSSEEKTAIFGRYKGRINNYLSAEGYDLKQAGKDWTERRKAKQTTPSKEPQK
jgi:Spy/CpxP family protein refolding chaperone